MPERAPQPVTAIPHDVPCPQCGYNLRGLHGYIVDCPECGARCDVAMLMTRQWTGPWFRAPGFSLVSYAVLWLLGAAIVAVLTPVFVIDVGDAAMGVGVLLSTLLLVGWAVNVTRICRRFGVAEGLALVALAHVLFVGYSAGGVALVLGGLYLLFNFTVLIPAFDYTLVTVPIVMVVGAGIVWACRRGERFIAGRCIRRHLRGAAVTA